MSSIPSISVVVPTLNGGSDLEALLDSLLAQTGVDLEILVLDSQSTDSSPALASRSNAIRWITRPRAEFNHSGTRNRGVQLARHPLVFLTVQDATLGRPDALARLAELLANGGWGAVSVKEEPKADADAYARFALHSYYEGMFNEQTTLVHKSWSGDARDRIVAASLNNVGCLYRREVVAQYGFQGHFGEDFDLGVRLLRAGVSLAKTCEVRVSHSHNRPAFYALKRMYLSRRLMLRLEAAEQGPWTSENQPLLAIADMVRLFTTAPVKKAMEEIRHHDKTLADWLTAMGLPVSSGPVNGELVPFVESARRWGPELLNVDRVFTLKVLAGALGWCLGGVEDALWSEERRGLVRRLSEDV